MLLPGCILVWIVAVFVGCRMAARYKLAISLECLTMQCDSQITYVACLGNGLQMQCLAATLIQTEVRQTHEVSPTPPIILEEPSLELQHACRWPPRASTKAPL